MMPKVFLSDSRMLLIQDAHFKRRHCTGTYRAPQAGAENAVTPVHVLCVQCQLFEAVQDVREALWLRRI